MPRLSLIVDPSGAEAGLRRAEGASDRYVRSMGLAARATDRTVGAFDRMRRSLFSLQGAFGALGGALAVRSFVELSDAATQAENRLRVVTSSSQELARVQSELFEIAQRTRTEFTATADLYARLSLVSTELGVSQGEIAKFTEGVGQALAVTGTSAQQARGALIQLGQAVGSGIVRAEEFNSILEGAPRILQAVAAGMDGAGISVAELRNRVIDGAVSSREFFDAFTSQLPTLEREFAQTQQTIGQALTGVRNELIRSVGDVNNATGATKDLVGAINGVAAAVASEGFRQGVGLFAEGLALVARNLDLVVIGAGAFLLAMNPVAAGVGTVALALAASAQALGEYDNLFRQVVPLMDTLADSFSGVGRVVSVVADNFQEFALASGLLLVSFNPILGALSVGAAVVAGLVGQYRESRTTSDEFAVASAELAVSLERERHWIQQVNEKLQDGTEITVASTRVILVETTQRYERIKAIIAEQRALALQTNEFAKVSAEIKTLQALQENESGSDIQQNRLRADAFNARAESLRKLVVRQEELLSATAAQDEALKEAKTTIETMSSRLEILTAGIIKTSDATSALSDESQAASESLKDYIAETESLSSALGLYKDGQVEAAQSEQDRLKRMQAISRETERLIPLLGEYYGETRTQSEVQAEAERIASQRVDTEIALRTAMEDRTEVTLASTAATESEKEKILETTEALNLEIEALELVGEKLRENGVTLNDVSTLREQLAVAQQLGIDQSLIEGSAIGALIDRKHALADANQELEGDIREVVSEQERLRKEVERFEMQPAIDGIRSFGDALTGSLNSGIDSALEKMLGFSNEFTGIISSLISNTLARPLVIPLQLAAGELFGLSPKALGFPQGVGGSSGGGGTGLFDLISGGLGAADKLSGLFGFGGAASGLAGAGLAGAGAFGALPALGSLSATGIGAGAAGALSFGAAPALGSVAGAGTFGGAAGAGGILGALGPALSVAGPLLAIAGLALPLLSGVFGPKPSNKLQGARFVDGAFEGFEGQTGKKFSQGNQDAAGTLGEFANTLFSRLEGATGADSSFSAITALVGDRSGTLLDFFRDDPGKALGVTGDLRVSAGSEAEALSGTLDAFLGSVTDLDAEFRRVLESIDATDQDAVSSALKSIESFGAIRTQLAGLDAEGISPLQTAIEAINTPLGVTRELLDEFGLSVEDLNTLQARLNADLKAGFLDGLEAANRQLSGRGFLDAILGQVNGFTDAFASADFIGEGADLVADNLRLSLSTALGSLGLDQMEDLEGFLVAASDGSERFTVALDALVAAEEAAQADLARAAQEGAEARLAAETVLLARTQEALGQFDGATQLAVRGLNEGEFGFRVLTGILGQATVGAKQFAGVSQFLSDNLELLERQGVNVTSVLDLFASRLPEVDDALETTVDTIDDSAERIADAAEALAARLSALSDLEAEIIQRTDGEAAARAFRLTSQGLGEFLDEIEAIDAGSLAGARAGLKAFFDEVRASGVGGPSVEILGREALAVFDAIEGSAANSAGVVEDTFASLSANITSILDTQLSFARDALDDSIAGLRASTDRFISGLQASFRSSLDALARDQRAFLDAGSRAGEVRAGLLREGTTPQLAFDGIREQFEATAGLASGGNLGAIQSLSGQADGFVDAARSAFGEGTREFAEAVAFAQESLADAQNASVDQAAEIRANTSRMASQLDALVRQARDATDNQISALEAAAERQAAAMQSQTTALVEQLRALIDHAQTQNDLAIRQIGAVLQNATSLDEVRAALRQLEREFAAANNNTRSA